MGFVTCRRNIFFQPGKNLINSSHCFDCGHLSVIVSNKPLKKKVMKTRLLFFWALLFSAVVCHSQSVVYTGRFRVIGPGSDNADIYINELSITLTAAGEAKVVLHFKGGSHTEKEDYVDLTGTINGTSENGILLAKGSINTELKDGKNLQTGLQPTTIKGSFTADRVEGKVFLYESASGTRTDAYLSFIATASKEIKPELTFPAGISPKVFNKGWVFGASFSISDKDGNEVDLSDKVEWSGTGTFNPLTGKESYPVFSAIGANKIILTVKYEGKTYKGEYNISTVDVSRYAHVGSLAACPADGHGGPSCPHKVVGPVIEGSPLVLINGYPAARVGDNGVHHSCAGSNTFTIATGDNEVLIGGKAAALFGLSQTKHCGGMGKLLPADQQLFVSANKDVTVTNNGVKKEAATNLSVDDEITTGPKGLISFSNGVQSGVTLFPSTTAKVLEDIPSQMKLLIKHGALMADGKSASGKKLIVELKNLIIKPNGTKFYVIADSLQSVISVYDGSVTVTDKTTGNSNNVDSGYSYTYSGSKPEIVRMADSSGEKLQWSLIAAADNTSIQTTFSSGADGIETPENTSVSTGAFLKKNIIYISGGIILLGLVALVISKKKKRARI